jgi:hypothetical protein
MRISQPPAAKVITVAAVRLSVYEAVHSAYEWVGKVTFRNMHYLKDIDTRFVSPLCLLTDRLRSDGPVYRPLDMA